jgi:hypothetical protein
VDYATAVAEESTAPWVELVFALTGRTPFPEWLRELRFQRPPVKWKDIEDLLNAELRAIAAGVDYPWTRKIHYLTIRTWYYDVFKIEKRPRRRSRTEKGQGDG